MPKQELVSLALVRMRNGQLPRADGSRLYAGSGHDECCALCDRAIRPTEIEYEVGAGLSSNAMSSVFFHFYCYEAWVLACRAQPSLSLSGAPSVASALPSR